MAQPQPKSDELFDQILSYLLTTDRNELTLVRFKQQTERLLGVLPSDINALMAALMVALMRNKRAEFDAIWARIRRHPLRSDVVVQMNVVRGLYGFGDFNSAREQLYSMLKDKPNHPVVLKAAADDAAKSGRARAAIDFYQRGSGAALTLGGALPGISELHQFLEDYGVSDDEVASVVEPFFQAICNFSDRPHDGGMHWSVIPVEIDGSPVATLRIKPAIKDHCVPDLLDRYVDLLAENNVPFELLARINVDVEGVVTDQEMLRAIPGASV